MAIAYDAVSVLGESSNQITISHTCTGSNLVLIVGIMDKTDAAEQCTGVTYDGDAMTKIDSIRGGDGIGRWLSLWYKIAPSTGANNIVASFNDAGYHRCQGVSYTGCRQSDVPENSSTQTTGADAAYDHSLTSAFLDCWHIFFPKNDTGTHAAGTGTTLRGVATDSNIMDSNSAKNPAGSVTLQATHGSSPKWGSIMITLSPPGSHYDVDSSVIIGVKVTASRAVATTKASSVIVGVLVTASVVAAFIRAASVLIGVLVSATKAVTITRTASVIIGTVVSASRAVAVTRTASVIVGSKVTASRVFAATRTATVQIWVSVSATRTVAFTRASSVIVGIKVSATILKVRYFIGHLITSAYRMGNAITAKYRRGESITASPKKGEFIEGE